MESFYLVGSDPFQVQIRGWGGWVLLHVLPLPQVLWPQAGLCCLSSQVGAQPSHGGVRAIHHSHTVREMKPMLMKGATGAVRGFPPLLHAYMIFLCTYRVPDNIATFDREVYIRGRYACVYVFIYSPRPPFFPHPSPFTQLRSCGAQS